MKQKPIPPAFPPTPQEILDFRLSLNLTQKDIGELVHYKPSSWSNFESGICKINKAAWELLLIKLERLDFIEQGSSAMSVFGFLSDSERSEG